MTDGHFSADRELLRVRKLLVHEFTRSTTFLCASTAYGLAPSRFKPSLLFSINGSLESAW